MKKKLLKSMRVLLVAAGLCTGANAWADAGDVTTNANIDCTGTISEGVLAGTVNSMTIGTGGAETSIVNNTYMKLGDHSNTVTIPEAKRAGTRDIVTVSFDMAWGNKNSMGSGIALKDADGTTIAYFDKARWGSDAGNMNITWTNILGAHSSNQAVWNNRTHFVITLNYATNVITTAATLGSTTETFTAILTNTNPVATFAVRGYNAGSNADRASLFGNLIINTTEGDYTISSANYTINWVCGETILKTDTRIGDVGSGITLLASDKEKFLTDENTKKYSYVTDDSSEKSVAEDGSTVVTITCEEIGKYNYSVTTSVGSIIDEGSLFNDETKTISWSKYIEKDGDYYQATAPFQFTVTKDATSKEVSVTASQVTQFLEITSSNWSTTSVENANLSGGIAWRGVSSGGTKTMLTVAETGVYSINYAVFSTNTGSGKEFDFSLYKNDASVDANLIETFSVNHSLTYVLTTGTRTIENVLLLAGDKIIAKSGNTTCALDYIALAKTGDYTTTATVSSAGWATLYTPYALDFSGVSGLTAYTATCSESTVTLTAVENVPANTGVVLKGAAATYSIPVIASSATDKGHLLGSATDATVYNAYEGYTLYMLNKVNGKAQFVPVTSGEIAAGKAFLKIASASGNSSLARNLNVEFAEDVTGISMIEDGKQKIQDGYYNLSGQRISQPTKGLYIVNGKKVVIK